MEVEIFGFLMLCTSNFWSLTINYIFIHYGIYIVSDVLIKNDDYVFRFTIYLAYFVVPHLRNVIF